MVFLYVETNCPMCVNNCRILSLCSYSCLCCPVVFLCFPMVLPCASYAVLMLSNGCRMSSHGAPMSSCGFHTRPQSVRMCSCSVSMAVLYVLIVFPRV